MIDTHAHLDFDRFDDDRDRVIEAAHRGGVGRILTIGIDLESNERALALTRRHPGVFAALGIHPNNASGLAEDDWARLREQILRPETTHRVLAIGETGLDFHWDHASPADQETAFGRQIALARELERPVIIHCRDAYERTGEILAEEWERSGPVPGVMHCFAGGPAEATRFLALGLHLSFAGPLTYKKSEALRAIARDAPADRILVETDCPFLPPVPHRGQRNEPLYTRITAEALASARGVHLDEIEAITDRNAIALFRFPPAPWSVPENS